MEFEGISTVLANLNKEILNIEKRTLSGLIRASIIIRRAMENPPRKIPVDTGNLRASFFVVTNKGSFFGSTAGGVLLENNVPTFIKGASTDVTKLQAAFTQAINDSKVDLRGEDPKVRLGFSAWYAWKVHENLQARYMRPGSGAKFLEYAIKSKSSEILEIIRKEAAIK